MADEQEIRVKFTADTSDLERGARKAEEAVRRTQQGGSSGASSKATDKAVKGQEKVAKATKQVNAETASWKSIMGSINPQFGSLADKADEAFGRMTEGLKATGKGAGVAKAAGVAAMAAIAVEAIGIGMKIKKAIWDFAKSAFKAFDPIQYSKTFGTLEKAFKRFKTAMGGLLEGPVQVLVYTATGLLNTLSKIVIKMYELQKRLGVMTKVVNWFKDVLDIDEDLNASLDGTLASFDRLNVLGQDEGDQDTRDEMKDIDKENEDANDQADAYKQTAEEIRKTLEGTSLPVLNWISFFGDAPETAKKLVETILSIKYPDLDWSAFFGDSQTISTQLAETILSIAVPEGDWDGYFGDAPTVSKQLAATLLGIQVPEINWTEFFGDSETISTKLAATLLGLMVPSVNWSGLFGDAETVSRNIAQTLLGISLPTVDWGALFSDAPTVSTNIAQTLLGIAVPTVDWSTVFSDAETVSTNIASNLLNIIVPTVDWGAFFGDSETVSASVAANLMNILVPEQDWTAYFGDAPTVSKQLLEDILASKYPDQDWSSFFSDSGSVSTALLTTILSSVYPDQDWSGFFSDSDTVSKALLATILSSVYPDQDWTGFFSDSQTVATTLLETLLKLAPPGTVDWSGFFKGGEDGNKKTQEDLDDLHAPTISWENAFAGFFSAIVQAATELDNLRKEAAKGITVTVKKVYEGVKNYAKDVVDSLTDKGNANVTSTVGSGNTSIKKATETLVGNGKSNVSNTKAAASVAANPAGVGDLSKLDYSAIGDSVAEALSGGVVSIPPIKTTLQPASYTLDNDEKLVIGLAKESGVSLSQAVSSAATAAEKQAITEYWNSIPEYASGGVFAPGRPTLGIIGDNTQEYEVISPVSTIVDSVKRAITELNGSSGGGGIGGTGPIELTINLDGRRIARQIYDPLQAEARRRGASI